MQINLVSRIAADKNSFFDLVFIAYALKKEGVEDVNILFIGEVQSTSIYSNILRMADLLNVSDKISFTKRSIPMAELPPDIKDGYFFNFSIGDFMGYSGIESIEHGFKTILMNTDRSITLQAEDRLNVCQDIPAVISLLMKINEDAAAVEEEAHAANLKLKANYLLSDDDTALLLSLMLPNDQ